MMMLDTATQFKPQKISFFKDSLLLHQTDFPIYYIECLSERHFIVAGGGGDAKTGVHNQINIFELVPTKESCAANLVTKYHTPKEIPEAIMTAALMRHMPISDTRLVTGGSFATIYNIIFDAQKSEFRLSDYEPLKDVLVEPDLKCVKCIPGKILTGGMTGQLASWNHSEESKSIDKIIRAHSKPIDEIDINIHNQQVVTLSRDEGRCAVWSLPNLKLVTEFKKDFINKLENNTTPDVKYIFRSCRYASNKLQKGQESQRDNYLIVACNPIPAGKNPCRLFRWIASDYKNYDSMSVKIEGIMAMTVSYDGKYLALGSRTGSVTVLEVKSLNQIYNIDHAHLSLVTCLEFLEPKQESLNLTNSTCCALLSASIDRRVVIHRLKKGSITSSVCKIIMMALMLYLISFYFLFKNNK